MVSTVRTDAARRFAVELPAATCRLHPEPVQGLLGTPEPRTVSVRAREVSRVALSYDTGIRRPGQPTSRT